MGSTVFKDETGKVYGRLTVLSVANFGAAAGTVRKWNCICECGNAAVVPGKDLRNGGSRSCGCIRQELARVANMSYRWKTKNGVPATQTAEYESWSSMINRCADAGHHAWDRYGGRGITVCDRWLNSFDAFVEDMGSRPSLAHSIDRYPNNDGNYEPGNCRWATPTEQNRNRKSNRLITCNGETKCLKEWSEISGIGRTTIRQRLELGWSVEDAIFRSTRSYG